MPSDVRMGFPSGSGGRESAAMQDARVLPLGREDGQGSMEGVMWSVEK